MSFGLLLKVQHAGHRIYKGYAIAIASIFATLLFCACNVPVPAHAQTFQVGIQESSVYDDALVLEAPHPEIPAELHEQCVKSCCIARFIIKPDGKHRVKLISSSGSADVDEIAIKTLTRWKFKPAMLNGKPVESTRKVKVEFEVE